MIRSFVSALLGFVVLTGTLFGQEDIQRGKIKKLDADKGTITITVDGNDRDFTVFENTRIADAGGNPAKDRLKHPGFKEGASVMFKSGTRDGRTILVGLKLAAGKQAISIRQKPDPVDLSKLIPLTDLGANEYRGFKGGLYPEGKNERPANHEAAGRALAKSIQPLDAEGKPNANGRIVLLSIGMSNTSQAFMGFMKAAGEDRELNPQLTIVNGAQGGMTAALIQNVNASRYWPEVDNRLKQAGVTRAQVQAVWIKQADAGPNQGFPQYAMALQGELARIVQLLHTRFSNLKLAYLSSRTYGGYAKTRLNPEPYAFESGFSVKWLIEEQLKGEIALNYDPNKGEVKAPWLSWGPYLWARGSAKRNDGFRYEESDFSADDGTHESPAGQRKIGQQLLQFFKTDSTSKPWFVKRAGS